MRTIQTLVLLIICINIYAQNYTTHLYQETQSYNQCNSSPWLLVFEDDFNSSDLDINTWDFGTRIRICNKEQQYYTNGSNVNFNNGIMQLIAKEETITTHVVDWLPDNYEILYCNDGITRGLNLQTFHYTSENIETIKKFTYGKFDACIKIPKGIGFWPAFWLFGGDPVYNEIDIFEFWNEDNTSNLSKVHNMCVHYDFGLGRRGCDSKYKGVDFSQSFHKFTLIWKKNKIEWYVDGVLKRSDPKLFNLLNFPTSCNISNEFYKENVIFPEDPMHLIFNFAIQSENNSPDNTTIFPAKMEIDWVRYYHRSPNSTVVVNNPNDYPLYNNKYNIITGSDVELECCIGLAGAELEIIGRNSITFDPGFELNKNLALRNPILSRSQVISLLLESSSD